MSTPMTPAQLITQLRKWGVKYAEYRDWSTHNRGNRGTGWGPVNGFMVHHTGSDSTDQRALLYNGTADLPGPLCHFGLAQDGTVHLIGWGRANHAGLGDPDVLAAVQTEAYADNPPADNQASVDGNSRFYGVEIWYSGGHDMSAAQYATLRRLAAAICDHHGWSAKSVIGHGEWGSPGKWDPGHAPGRMMDMAKVRSDIAVTLSGAVKTPAPPATPADKPSSKPPAKPTDRRPLVDLSKLVDAARRNPSAKGTPVTYSGVRTVEAALVRAGHLAANLADGHYGQATVKAYAAWQRHLGYSGQSADGIPGMASLTALAARYGFRVVG